MYFNNFFKVISQFNCSRDLFPKLESSSHPFLSSYRSNVVSFSTYCLVPNESHHKGAFDICEDGSSFRLKSGGIVYQCCLGSPKGLSLLNTVEFYVPEYQNPRTSKNGNNCYTSREMRDRENTSKHVLNDFVRTYLNDFDKNYVRSGFDELCRNAYSGVQNPALPIIAITALFACDDLIDNVSMSSGYMHLISGRFVQSLQSGILDRLPTPKQLPFIIDTLALGVDLSECGSFLETKEQRLLQAQEGYNLFPFTHIAKVYCRSGGVCPDAAPTYESKLESYDGPPHTKRDISAEKSFRLLQSVSSEDRIAFGKNDSKDILKKEALESVMRKIGNDLCDQVMSGFQSDRWMPVLVDYINTYRQYVLGTKLEVYAREKNHTFSEKVYKSLRRKTGGVEVAFSIGCIMLGIDWPKISGIDEIKDLRNVANDHIVWFNDLTSVLKDLIEGFDENLVINKVQNNKDMMFDEAFGDVLSEINKCMDRLRELIGEIKEKYPDNEDVQAYCRFVKNWIRANVDWSKDTNRYGYETLHKKFCV